MQKCKVCMLFAVFTVLSGCASFSSYQTAQSLGEGKSQFAIGLTVTDQSVDGPEADYEEAAYFTPELIFRTGVTDGFDVGAKLYVAYPIVGVVINGKYQFLDGPGLDMAVDFGVGYSGVELNNNDITYVDFYPALLMTYNFSDTFSATLAPKVVIRRAKVAGAGTDTESFPGATLTLSLGKKVKVMPEVGYYKGKDRLDADVEVVHFGIGFGFDF